MGIRRNSNNDLDDQVAMISDCKVPRVALAQITVDTSNIKDSLRKI
jgi:hypothetical protein